MVYEFDIGKIVDFLNGYGICNYGIEVLYFVFVYKVFYFYEKLDNIVFCKDVIYFFMISFDLLYFIFCILIKFRLFYYLDFDIWFLSFL